MRSRPPLRAFLLAAALALAPSAASAQVLLTPPSGVPGQTVVASGTIPTASLGLLGLPWSVQPAGVTLVARNVVNANTGAFTVTLAIAPTAPPGVYQIVVVGRLPTLVATFQVNAAVAERVVGPRVDAIRPSELQQGQQYHLELAGKNLAATTRIDLGPGVQALGAPMVYSPAAASLDVLVAPAAPLGPREAVATDTTGTNTGPGGLEVVPAIRIAPAVAAAVRAKVVPPIEPIDALAPLDPDSARCVAGKGRSCEAPHVFAGTRFAWQERVPGLASYFVWELVDCSGAVLASAQTKRPELVLTEGILASLPPIDAAGTDRAAACAIHKLAPALASLAGAKRLAPSDPAAARVLAGLGTWSAGHARIYVPAAGAWTSGRAAPPGAAAGSSSGGPLVHSAVAVPAFDDRDAWKTSAGLAVWRVKGYAPERYVDGGVTGDMVQVEDSDENGIVAPLPPTGLLGCADAAPRSAVSVGPAAAAGAAASPCSNPSLLCAGEDQFAVLSGTVDLSRLPFDPGLPGYPGSLDSGLPASHAFLPAVALGRAVAGGGGKGGGAPADAGPQSATLRNVFVDWGDGTEPEPLAVQLLSKQDWRAVRIADGQRHAYLRPSSGAPYSIRIYADADPDAGHPTRTATATGLLRSLAGKIGAPGASRGSALARLGASDPSKVETAATGALSARHASTFLLACLSANVVGAPGQGSDEALHLLGARISWPDPYESASTPEVTDGSSALVPSLSVVYWGHGKVKVSWFVDGDPTPVEEDELPNELPAVGRADGEAGRMPFTVQASSAVPTPLAGSPHRLTARVTSLDQPPPAAATPDGRILRLSPARHSYREVHTVVTAAGIVPAPVSAAEAVAPGVAPRHVVEGVVMAVSPAEAAAGGGDAPPPAPEVDAPARSYSVRARQPGDPHDLRYRTDAGDYRVTDVTGFSTGGDGTSSGRGILHVYLPADSGSSLRDEHVSISFSGWKVDTSGSSDWVVKDGGGDVAVSTALHPLGFDVRLTRVRMSHTVVAVDGSVSIGALQGVPLPYGVSPPAWSFSSVPLPPAGDLYMELPDAGKLPIGYSGFVLDLSKVVIDFSSKQGKAPGSCLAGGAGEKWIGVVLAGKMHPPSFAIRAGKNLLPDIDFQDFAVGAGGFAAEVHADLGLSQSFGPITVAARKLDLKACNGDFDAQVGIEIDGVPILQKALQGAIQVTVDKGLVPKFDKTALKRDFGVVALDIGHASFGYDPAIGDWAVKVDSDATLKLPSGATVFRHQFPTIDVTLDGGVKISGQTTSWFPAGDTGTGDLAGFPVQVTKLGLGLRSNGGIWFGVSGGVRISDVFEAQASDVKFLLDPGGSGFQPAGVEVGDLHVDLHLPSVHATADVVFSAEGHRTRFGGEGEVALLGSGIGVKAEFLYGNDSGRTYWLAKGSLDAGGAGIALAPVPLAIYGFNGGIAHNVDLSTYGGPVKDVKPRFDGSYLLSAGLQVGTLDSGFTFYGSGKITIQLGTSPGVRLDVDAWLLSDDHGGAPAARGCIQYAGSAFDAGFQVDLTLADGAVRVHAPGGADVCTSSAVSVHFGAGEDWHVWLGTRNNPVTASILFVDAQGWLAADGSGVDTGVRARAGGGVSGTVLGCGWSLSYQEQVQVDVGLTFHPFQASGRFDGSISGAASACFGSAGFDGSLGLAAQAPDPTRICGSASVGVDLGSFHPSASFDVCL